MCCIERGATTATAQGKSKKNRAFLINSNVLTFSLTIRQLPPCNKHIRYNTILILQCLLLPAVGQEGEVDLQLDFLQGRALHVVQIRLAGYRVHLQTDTITMEIADLEHQAQKGRETTVEAPDALVVEVTTGELVVEAEAHRWTNKL